MNREGAEAQIEQLKEEAEFKRSLKIVFDTPEGLKLLEFMLALGNFGGVIRGDYACGAHAVSSQLWIEVLKAAPDAAKKIIDLSHKEYQHNRQEQFKQAETQLKEVDDE